jgi:prepilin peptidase CpaA
VTPSPAVVRDPGAAPPTLKPMSTISILQITALVILLGAAVYTDLRERRIPNGLTVSGLVVALLLAGVAERGFPGSSLAGAGLALLVSFPLVVLGGLGAGDAKLLTAVGAFVGAGGLFPVLIYGALAGGALAVGNAVRRGALLGLLVNVKNLLVHWASLGRRGQRISLNSPGAQSVPYALAIAAGALLTWFFPFSIRG